eukprot:4072820-Amphidinium_carterae.1
MTKNPETTHTPKTQGEKHLTLPPPSLPPVLCLPSLKNESKPIIASNSIVSQPNNMNAIHDATP